MGKTSNSAKQRWNTAHYTQVKVQVSPQTAACFKAACAVAGTSMANALGKFMDEYAKPTMVEVKPQVKVKTLRDRRKTMDIVCKLISDVRDAEEAYMDNMPDNLQNGARYEMAEERVESLTEVLDALGGLYDE